MSGSVSVVMAAIAQYSIEKMNFMFVFGFWRRCLVQCDEAIVATVVLWCSSVETMTVVNNYWVLIYFGIGCGEDEGRVGFMRRRGVG